MKTLLVPTFSEVWPIGATHHTHQFKEYTELEVNDEPTGDDYQKVTRLLPGIPCGFCGAFETSVKTGKPIPITSFYDIRQRGVNKLKNYFITVKN